LKVTLQKELRTNTYNADAGILTVSAIRAEAIAENSQYYAGLFTNDPARDEERDAYSIPENSLKDPERVRKLNSFFFWISWACVTERPGQEITYTNNWPPEELVANRPTGALLLWTGFSVIMLIAGIGLMGWQYARRREESQVAVPQGLSLKKEEQTPSQKATVKYFWVVSALLLVQVTRAHHRTPPSRVRHLRHTAGRLAAIPYRAPGIFRLQYSDTPWLPLALLCPGWGGTKISAPGVNFLGALRYCTGSADQ
jgi:nitric oxide reductase subunit B